MTSDATPDSRTRVLPLILDAGNHQLLVEWIDEHPSFEPVELADGIDETTFDVCLLDRAAFQKHHDELRAKKAATAPVLLPYLLLLPESGSDIIEADAGQLADNVVTETIDELVTLPIQQAELHWRLAALLRLRNQSLTLHNRTRELERQVDLFKQAQDIADVGAWEYDIDADEWWWSDEVRRILALPADTPPSPDESFQYYHPDSRSRDHPRDHRAHESPTVVGGPWSDGTPQSAQRAERGAGRSRDRRTPRSQPTPDATDSVRQ